METREKERLGSGKGSGDGDMWTKLVVAVWQELRDRNRVDDPKIVGQPLVAGWGSSGSMVSIPEIGAGAGFPAVASLTGLSTEFFHIPPPQVLSREIPGLFSSFSAARHLLMVP